MYIHLGGDTIVKSKDIVGIFDLDSTTISKHSRKFLNLAEKRGEVETVTFELPKAFVLCSDGDKKKIYLTQLSSTTLEKRAESRLNEEKEKKYEF